MRRRNTDAIVKAALDHQERETAKMAATFAWAAAHPPDEEAELAADMAWLREARLAAEAKENYGCSPGYYVDDTH